MKRKLLSAPLRVFWDISPYESGGLDPGKALTVARELCSLKVFFVTLTPVDGPRPDTGELVRELKKGGVRVVLSVSAADLLPAAEDASAADTLDLCPRDLPTLHELLSLSLSGAAGGAPLSLSIVPAKGGYELAAEMLAASIAAGIRTFNLPNPRLVNDGAKAEEYALGDSDRSAWKAVLETHLKPLGAEARVSVHDLFLHRDLELPGLGGRIEYAGCQAGDAIAFIDETGVVYPCASWSEPLGDIRWSSLKEVWSGEPRADIRARAATLPAECKGCPEASICKGGCRGLAWQLGGADAKDPSCCGR